MSEKLHLPIISDPEEPRCACLLLLDVSHSMSGARIEELNKGLQRLAVELSNDSLASKRVEVGIVTFGLDVQVHSEFVSARDFRPEPLSPNGATPMGEAVVFGLDYIEERKAIYDENGIARYQPWVFLITDGGPTDEKEPVWDEAIRRVKDGERKRKFALFPIGVEGADFHKLRELCVREPLQLRGLMFSKLFEYVSRSLKSVSRSNPGDEIPMENPSGWGTLPT